jgi:hypothetical protein
MAAYVGAPTMMDSGSLFYVWLHGVRGSDKNRNGTVLFFNDITAFNVVNYCVLNNIMAFWLRYA